MGYGPKVALILSAAVLTLGVALAAPDTGSSEEAPLPAPSTSPSLAPSPASQELRDWALMWRRRAVRAWERWNRARACFDLSHVYFASPRPPRSASSDVWLEAGREWKQRVPVYREKTAALRYRMIHPGGAGGERWRPLVRWHWPAYLVDDAVRCLSMESGGWPGARNPSGAAGLFQLYPAPDGWANPDYNVSYAYWHKFVPALRAYGNGWLPWASSLGL